MALFAGPIPTLCRRLRKMREQLTALCRAPAYSESLDLRWGGAEHNGSELAAAVGVPETIVQRPLSQLQVHTTVRCRPVTGLHLLAVSTSSHSCSPAGMDGLVPDSRACSRWQQEMHCRLLAPRSCPAIHHTACLPISGGLFKHRLLRALAAPCRALLTPPPAQIAPAANPPRPARSTRPPRGLPHT